MQTRKYHPLWAAPGQAGLFIGAMLFRFLLCGSLAAAPLFAQANSKKKAKKPVLIVAGAVAGRTTFAAPLARDFAKKNKVVLNVHSGGSELGIQAVYEKYADIAIASRTLSATERDKGLRDSLIAYDAIAVVVHKNHFLNTISHKQLKKILRGKIKSWKKLNGPDVPIRFCLPDSNSALRAAFLHQVLQDKKLKAQPKVFSSTIAVIANLRSDTLAIGICSATQTHYRHLKTLKIDDIQLNNQTVADRIYPFITPVTLITLGKPDARESLFFDWVIMGPAAKLVAEHFVQPELLRSAAIEQDK